MENKSYSYYISYVYSKEVFSFDFFGANSTSVFGAAHLNYNKPLEEFLMEDYEEIGTFTNVNDYIVPGGRIYEQREYIYNALTDIPGITAVKPKAAFYMFPKIDVKKFGIVSDEKFALDLLREKKILLVHGGGFNWGQPDHFRVVYLPRIEVLKEAAGKLKDFLSTYHQSL